MTSPQIAASLHEEAIAHAARMVEQYQLMVSTGASSPRDREQLQAWSRRFDAITSRDPVTDESERR